MKTKGAMRAAGAVPRSALLRGTAALAGGWALAACGGTGQQAAGTGVTKEPVRLQLFNQSGTQQDISDWTEMVKPFTEK